MHGCVIQTDRAMMGENTGQWVAGSSGSQGG
ncbi:hypothetical protein J2W98_000662 [Paenibacillus peoriae]|uniref:Uncharacterized protein n=1 Tax=Paenibacillus peoriae TaxID=59893 RepID=A0ABU1QB40_9BACL|nr:hypothetical protein [Paenibacillus peoriae]